MKRPANPSEYRDYLKGEHWKTLRSKKRSKSNKWCAICGSKERLETHHLIYRNIFDVETPDLRIFCHRCHSVAHLLMRNGLTFRSKKAHGIFGALKWAVKNHLGIANENLFRDK